MYRYLGVAAVFGMDSKTTEVLSIISKRLFSYEL